MAVHMTPKNIEEYSLRLNYCFGLYYIQSNYSWKRNTAKSCTKYSQNICIVVKLCQVFQYSKGYFKVLVLPLHLLFLPASYHYLRLLWHPGNFIAGCAVWTANLYYPMMKKWTVTIENKLIYQNDSLENSLFNCWNVNTSANPLYVK